MSNTGYSAKEINHLKGLEGVRKRPGMYIGNQTYAKYQMLYEILDNSMDEFVHNNNASNINININEKYISVSDEGRGIPIGYMDDEDGRSALEVVLTELHAGGKFGQSGYNHSSGLHGVGLSVVNALSSTLTVYVCRNNNRYMMQFQKGIKIQDLQIVEKNVKRTGTEIIFEPDSSLETIIYSDNIELSVISERLQKVVTLNIGLCINLNFHGTSYKFQAEKFTDFLKGTSNIIDNEMIYFEHANEKKKLQVALAWHEGQDHKCLAFTNGIEQHNGGEHINGFRSALRSIFDKSITEYVKNSKKKLPKFTQSDILPGLHCAISLYMNDPQFSSQTKDYLSTKDAYRYTREHVQKFVFEYLEHRPNYTKKLIEKILNSAARREAEARVRKNHKSERFVIPTKLAACSSNKPEECELFIVEGDSAGGSVKGGRNRQYQAVYPLRGKLMNVMRATPQKIYNVKEITELIATLGCKKQKDMLDISGLRYHKIVIMTDADKDGLHILTLVIIMFIKVMPDIIRKGHLYVVYPPLYKINIRGKKPVYVQNNEEKDLILNKRLLNNLTIYKNNKQMNVQEFMSWWEVVLNYVEYIKTHNRHLSLRDALSFAFYENNSIIETICHVEILKKTKKKNLIECEIYSNQLGKGLYQIYKNKDIQKPDLDDITIEQNQNTEKKSYFIHEIYDIIRTARNKGITISRFKGLGEMNPEELEVTCLKPKNRTLVQLNAINDDYESAFESCEMIMGNSDERRELIRRYFNIPDRILNADTLSN